MTHVKGHEGEDHLALALSNATAAAESVKKALEHLYITEAALRCIPETCTTQKMYKITCEMQRHLRYAVNLTIMQA